MRRNFLMSEQSRRRPLGVTLLGYLLLLMAFGQGQLFFSKDYPFYTFLGFLAPAPLPHIEVALKLILFIVLGVGLLRMERWARWLLIISLYISLATTLVGAVLGWMNQGRATQIDEMFPGAVDTQANMMWLVQLIIAVGILVLLLIYSYRLKSAFQGPDPKQLDKSDQV